MRCGLRDGPEHRDTQRPCLVDEVVGDARTGEGDDALGQEFQEFVVPAEGSGTAVLVPVGLADDLVDAVALGPACRDALDAGAAAMHEHHVGILGAGLVEPGDDGGGVLHVLAAGDGDEGAAGQVRFGLAVLAGADEVAGVDGGGGQLAGLRDMAAVAGAPGLAGGAAVGVGGGVAQGLEGVAAAAEVLRPVGDQLQLAGLEMLLIVLPFRKCLK